MNASKILWRISVAIFVGFAFLYPFINPPEPLLPELPIETEGSQVIPDFSKITDVIDKKRAFFDYLLPEVERQNDYLISLRLTVKALSNEYSQQGELTPADRHRLEWLVSEYKVPDDLSLSAQLEILLRRVDIIPAELVLVQAANESAWGTSRFAREGFNLFGLWCFRKGCGFVPKQRIEGAQHEVAKFPNLARATYTYMRNLNRHNAYKSLRDIRSTLRQHERPISGVALSEGLMQYSERGEDYIDELQQMIRVNQEYISL